MDNTINIFPKGTIERAKLQNFADHMNSMPGNSNIQYEVGETYFDFGQGWKWTTIIAHDRTREKDSVLGSWQALTPKDQENILSDYASAMDELAQRLAKRHR